MPEVELAGRPVATRCTVWPSISPVAGVMVRADVADAEGAVITNNGTTNRSRSVTWRDTLRMIFPPEPPPEGLRVVQPDDRGQEVLNRQPVVW